MAAILQLSIKDSSSFFLIDPLPTYFILVGVCYVLDRNEKLRRDLIIPQHDEEVVTWLNDIQNLDDRVDAQVAVAKRYWDRKRRVPVTEEGPFHLAANW